MPLTLITVPCLDDNYAFLLGDPATGEAAVVDVPEAAPITAALAEAGWRLTTVLLTHHHWDHVDGLKDLAAAGLRVIGARADAHRLPRLTEAVSEGDRIDVLGETAHILDVSGHTMGHIAFHLPGPALAFTGDSLMAMGCGRLFEGTARDMWHSMQKLRKLPPETTICSGHEYTLTNARFAATLEPENPRLKSALTAVQAARDAGRATVPTQLRDEMATNPYLRADDPGLMSALGLSAADPADVFAEIRRRKDTF